MNTKHTPGPWKVISVDWTPSGNARFEIEGICRTGIADARLISAAPELLEACRQMMRWFEVEDDHSQMPEFMDRLTLCHQVEVLASAAIAKATGEQQ